MPRFQVAEKETIRTKKLNDLAERPVQVAFVGDLLADGQLIWRAVTDRPLTLAEIVGDSDDAATAQAVFTLKNGSTTIATSTWAAAGTAGVGAIVDPIIPAGSTLYLYAPSPQDATLKNGTIRMTFRGKTNG